MPELICRNSPRESVARTIQEWIAAGRLSPAVPLPAETDLAARLSVSRGTARAALEALEEQGVLEKRNRKRYVAEAPASGGGLPPRTVALLAVNTDHPARYLGTGNGAAAAAGALARLSQLSWNALSIHGQNLDAATMRTLPRLAPDAVLAFAEALVVPGAEDFLLELWQHDIPLVLNFDGPRFRELDRVFSDFADATAEVVRRLHRRGCRRILEMRRGGDMHWQTAKHEGYLRAVNELGLPCLAARPIPLAELLCQHYDREDFERQTRLFAGYLAEFLTGPEPADAIIATTDRHVPPLAAACRLFGREPGRDVLLAGYDHSYEQCPWRPWLDFPPSLSVDKHNTRIGEAMVELLQAERRRRDGRPPRRVVIPATIVER